MLKTAHCALFLFSIFYRGFSFCIEAVFALLALIVLKDILIDNYAGFFAKAVPEKAAGDADTDGADKSADGAAHNDAQRAGCCAYRRADGCAGSRAADGSGSCSCTAEQHAADFLQMLFVIARFNFG